MPTLYALKPAFQDRLRPLVGRLAAMGVTANGITLLAAGLSIAAGLAIVAAPGSHLLLLLIPLVLFVRMALNAMDGMLAREHGQASTLGMYLNEICDVISDLALILPFTAFAQFGHWGVLAFAMAAMLAEFAGVFDIDKKNGGMTLKELAPGVTVDEIKSKTEATFKVPNTL